MYDSFLVSLGCSGTRKYDEAGDFLVDQRRRGVDVYRGGKTASLQLFSTSTAGERKTNGQVVYSDFHVPSRKCIFIQNFKM